MWKLSVAALALMTGLAVAENAAAQDGERGRHWRMEQRGGEDRGSDRHGSERRNWQGQQQHAPQQQQQPPQHQRQQWQRQAPPQQAAPPPQQSPFRPLPQELEGGPRGDGGRRSDGHWRRDWGQHNGQSGRRGGPPPTIQGAQPPHQQEFGGSRGPRVWDGNRNAANPNGWQRHDDNNNARNRGGDHTHNWNGDDHTSWRRYEGDRRWHDDRRRGGDDESWRWGGSSHHERYRHDRRFDNGRYRGYGGDYGWNRRWNDWRAIPHGGYFGRDHAHSLHRHWGGTYYWWNYSNWRRPIRGYRVGYILPSHLYWEPVPWEIYQWLPPPPYGCDYVMVGRDILLISLHSFLVIDALILSGY
jgi:hypothetical protein